VREGFKTVQDIINAGPEKLADVEGIGEKKAESIYEEAKKLLD
jgi:ERCC4-type nuclease